MLSDTHFLFLFLVYHFDVSYLGDDSTLVPNSLEDIGLFSIIFLEVDISGFRHLSQIFIIIIDCDMDLLEHVSDDKTNPSSILIKRRKDMINKLHLPVDSTLFGGLNLLKVNISILIVAHWSEHHILCVNQFLHPADLVLVVDSEDSKGIELVTVDVSLN